MKHLMKVILAGLLLQTATLFAQPEGPTALYYILDASGSMGGRIGEKAKIVVAKEVFHELIEGMPSDMKIGLMVYGHRRKADCTDIEELIPVGKLDRTQAHLKVKALQPKGKTPLTGSLTAAAERFKTRESGATIVLISDGIETCAGDPCAAVRALRESGVRFVVHVVGFDVDQEATRQLECIARAGGGKYFGARNAADLLLALNSLKANVVDKAPIPEQPPPPPPIEQQVSTKSTSVRVKVQGPGTVVLKPAAWLKAPYYWKLVDPETGELVVRSSGLEPVTVKAGSYQLVWRQAEHGARDVELGEVIRVEGGKTTEVVLATGINLRAPTWAKAPYRWRLKEKSTGENAAEYRETLAPQAVSPGEYILLWHQTEHGSQEIPLREISIEAGKLNDFELSTGINLVPAEWVSGGVAKWQLVSAEDPRTKFNFFGKLAPQLIPDGKYHLWVLQVDHVTGWSELGSVDVLPHQLAEFALNTGITFVVPSDKPAPYRVIFNPKAPGTNVELKGCWIPTLLRPGKYSITLREKEHGGADVVILDELEVPAGSLVEVEL